MDATEAREIDTHNFKDFLMGLDYKYDMWNTVYINSKLQMIFFSLFPENLDFWTIFSSTSYHTSLIPGCSC